MIFHRNRQNADRSVTRAVVEMTVEMIRTIRTDFVHIWDIQSPACRSYITGDAFRGNRNGMFLIIDFYRIILGNFESQSTSRLVIPLSQIQASGIRGSDLAALVQNHVEEFYGIFLCGKGDANVIQVAKTLEL